MTTKAIHPEVRLGHVHLTVSIQALRATEEDRGPSSDQRGRCRLATYYLVASGGGGRSGRAFSGGSQLCCSTDFVSSGSR